jgi:hypothetical protein
VAASPRWQASTSFTWCGSRLRTGASASSPRGGLAGQGSSTGAGANGGQADKRSAEDARESARRLRSLPGGQVLGDVLSSLLHAAPVKLGRRDARLLIDATAVAHEHARPYLPGGLTKQIDQVLGQLRLGQVNAESRPSQRAARPAGGQRPGPGPQPAADRCSAVTPPARHAGSLRYELRDVREPPIGAARAQLGNHQLRKRRVTPDVTRLRHQARAAGTGCGRIGRRPLLSCVAVGGIAVGP